METVILWLLILMFGLFIFGIVYGIPIVITILLHKFIQKRSSRKSARFLAWIPIILFTLFLCHGMYYAIYPDDDFYRGEFKSISGIELPKDAVIQHKFATYPNHFGEYSSTALIMTNSKFIETLPHVLQQQGLKKTENSSLGFHSFHEVMKQAEHPIIETHYSGSDKNSDRFIHYVGFLPDQKSMIITIGSL